MNFRSRSRYSLSVFRSYVTSVDILKAEVTCVGKGTTVDAFSLLW